MEKSLRFTFFLALAILLAPFFVSAAASNDRAEIHVDREGNARIEGAKVAQVAGTSFYVRLYWGDAFIRFIVKTKSNVQVTRSLGEPTTLSEVAVGDILSLSGQLESGSDSLVLVADTIKDLSIQKGQSKFSGVVTAVEPLNNRFTMAPNMSSSVAVLVGTTTKIMKGSRLIDLSRVKLGDKITKAVGEYDYGTKTLSAREITVYVDKNIFLPKNFQGTLKAIDGAGNPVVTIDGVEYTVKLEAGAVILNKIRESILLSRFLVGDKVRLYGNVVEADEPIINASVLRNINL